MPPGKEFVYAEVDRLFAKIDKYTLLQKKDKSARTAVNAYNEFSSGGAGAIANDTLRAEATRIFATLMNVHPDVENGILGCCGGCGGASIGSCGGALIPRNCLDAVCKCTEDIYVLADNDEKVEVKGPSPSTEQKPVFIGIDQPRANWAGCISPSCGFCDEQLTYWYVADPNPQPGEKTCKILYSGHSWQRHPDYPKPFMTSARPGCCSHGQCTSFSSCGPPASTCLPTALPSQSDRMAVYKGEVGSPFGSKKELAPIIDQLIGSTHEASCQFCAPVFNAKTYQNGNVAARWKLKGPKCWGGCKDVCCIAPFVFTNGSTEVGTIKKRRPKSCRDWFTACCTDDNQYSVRALNSMSAQEKALVLATSVQVHHNYFAKDGKPVVIKKKGDYFVVQCVLCHKFCGGMTLPIYCCAPIPVRETHGSA